MALERGYTMIQVTYEARDLLRLLAYKRNKPMYEAATEAIREALDKEEINHAGFVAGVAETMTTTAP